MRNKIRTFLYLIIFVILAFGSENLNFKANANNLNPHNELIKKQLSNCTSTDNNPMDKDELTKMYVRAIHDFMNAQYDKDKTVYDTLFIIQSRSGSTDDFPDIQLPEKLDQTVLKLISEEDANSNQFRHIPDETSPCINVIGWLDDITAEFIFVVFYPEFKHQYDCYIQYNFNDLKKDYEVAELRIEVLIYDMNNKPDHFAVFQNGKHIGDKPIQ